MPILIFIVSHWFLSLFCQTFFLHRYAAHRMFELSKFWERFFHILTFLTQGSSYLNARAYAIMHRMHHAYSDTEDDPHSPHTFKNLFAMMWNTKKIYHGLANNKIVCEPQFSKGIPEWPAFEKLTDRWVVRLLWGVLYSCFYLYFVTDLWLLALLPVHYLMGPIQGAIVNWCGHKYGYRNYDNGDKSRNTLVWDLLLMGELYQNNHHKFPNRMNFATRWFELDPAYPVIRLLGALKIVKMLPRSTRKETAALATAKVKAGFVSN